MSHRDQRIDRGVEQAVVLTRDEWSRIVALLASRDGDIAGAEDAVGTALERAVRTWGPHGVPDNPAGWIYRVAVNARRDVWKSSAAQTSVSLVPEAHDVAGSDEPDVLALPDERLQMLAMCVHPGIDPATRPLMMLSAVMGLSSRRIAEGMVLPAATVAARLTRAKKKIAAAQLHLRAPDRGELPAHLPDILTAIYATFTVEWVHASPDVREGLVGEAIHLAELVARLCPDVGESHGLASLLQLSAARFPARRTDTGEVIPLDAQDPYRWNRQRVAAGERHLREAYRSGQIGRFSIEAVIQAVHMQGVRSGHPDWPMLLRQHDHLLRIAPSIGASVARAAVLAHTDGPAAALDALDDLPKQASAYQPVWALRGHLLAELNRREAAREALSRAISLTTNSSERAHLHRVLECV